MSQGPPSSIRSLVFAVVSGAPEASRRLYTLCEGLRRSTSRVVIPQVLQSYTDLSRQFLRGSVHIGWAPPLLCLELERTAVAKAALCCGRNGRMLFHSALFTRKDSPIRTLQDLQGRSAAWVDRESSSGYVVPRLRLTAAGMEPSRMFRRESFLGTHAAVARAVLSGNADVGATYTSLDASTRRPLAAGWLEAGAGIDGVNVLTTAGPIPSDALVLSSALPPDIAAALVAGLAELPRHEPETVRALFGADAFERPQTGHFDALQKLVLGASKREWPPSSSR